MNIAGRAKTTRLNGKRAKRTHPYYPPFPVLTFADTGLSVQKRCQNFDIVAHDVDILSILKSNEALRDRLPLGSAAAHAQPNGQSDLFTVAKVG
jgi:hypothetical protein